MALWGGTTIRDIRVLVLLVLSEKDKASKFVSVNTIRNITGIYLANEIFQKLLSKLDISEQIKTKISGDGAFCKDNVNDPFKSEMKNLFREHIEFTRDLLHSINRPHKDAIVHVKSQKSKNS